MCHVNLEFPGDYRADFGYRAIETMAEFVRNARHKPLAPDDNAIAEPSVPARSPISSVPFPDEGQVCIASRGKVKKLCIEVIPSENTTIAVVFYRALEFNK